MQEGGQGNSMQRVCLQVPQRSESSQGEGLELVERSQPDLLEMTGYWIWRAGIECEVPGRKARRGSYFRSSAEWRTLVGRRKLPRNEASKYSLEIEAGKSGLGSGVPGPIHSPRDSG